MICLALSSRRPRHPRQAACCGVDFRQILLDTMLTGSRTSGLRGRLADPSSSRRTHVHTKHVSISGDKEYLFQSIRLCQALFPQERPTPETRRDARLTKNHPARGTETPAR